MSGSGGSTPDWYSAAAAAAAGRDREFLSSRFMAEAVRLSDTQGPSISAEFVRQALAALLAAGRPRIESQPFPALVHARIRKEFDRIEGSIRTADDTHFDLSVQALRCDFRIAGFSRIPVGVEHIEIGGVPRRLAWSHGLRQALDVTGVLGRARGWKPFYVAHLATGVKPWAFLMAYNPGTQESWHRTVAGCLELNPHVRGLLATSWWYDPQVTEVAPHLAFLRTGSLAHGAILVRAGELENARKHALANSPERQKLHASGTYIPVNYGVLWTREALLDWARS